MEHSKQISHVYQTLSHWLTFGDNIVIYKYFTWANQPYVVAIDNNEKGRLAGDGFMLHSCYA